jgi:hypothetical protein
LTCSRGDAFIEEIENSDLCVLNSDTPTRLPSQGIPNSPDLTLISAHLAFSAVWCTQVKLNSNHLPITIDVGREQNPKRTTKTYTNFRLADWACYIKETEEVFAGLPEPVSCDAGEWVFCVRLTASSHCIPSGHQKHYTPGLPRAAVPLVNRRDVLRSSDPQDPEVSDLNEEIDTVICDSSRKAWAEKVKLCGTCANPTKFWALLRNLSGKSARLPPNQPITFGTRTLSVNSKKIQ